VRGLGCRVHGLFVISYTMGVQGLGFRFLGLGPSFRA